MISSIHDTSAACTLRADSTSSPAERLFSRLDADGDGKINQDEFSTGLKQRLGSAADSDNAASSFESIFAKLDADSDGKVDTGEFQAGLKQAREALRGHSSAGGPPDPSKLFDEADTDSSGGVTASELQSHFESIVATRHPGAEAPDFAAMVENLDVDGDGVLSESELAAMRPEGGLRPGAAVLQAPLAEADASELFGSIDADGDGQISLAELQADLAARIAKTDEAGETSQATSFADAFAAIDSDGDGSISQSEFEEMMTRLEEQLVDGRDRMTYQSSGSRSWRESGATLSTWA